MTGARMMLHYAVLIKADLAFKYLNDLFREREKAGKPIPVFFFFSKSTRDLFFCVVILF